MNDRYQDFDMVLDKVTYHDDEEKDTNYFYCSTANEFDFKPLYRKVGTYNSMAVIFYFVYRYYLFNLKFLLLPIAGNLAASCGSEL